MKKLILVLSVLLGTTAMMTSCDNGAYDADPDTNNSSIKIPANTGGSNGGSSSFDWTGNDPMSAKIDGKAFLATSVQVLDFGGGFLDISGTSSTSNVSIDLYVPNNATAGTTYNFDNSTFAIYAEGADLYSANVNMGSVGAVKITENDATHIKGLFYFTCKNVSGTSKSLTEGYFNIKK